MFEITTLILNIVIAILFVTCILYWFKIGNRFSRLITKIKNDYEFDNFNRSDLDESENVFPDKWLDKHMDWTQKMPKQT